LTIFSRHLQWLTTQAFAQANPYQTGVQIGEKAQMIGFNAVDLTVRTTGHVDPSLVDISKNLPLMLKGIRDTGAFCDQITTNIVDDQSALGRGQTTEDLLKVAADNGIKRYRWGSVAYTVSNTAPFSPFGNQVLEQLRALSDRMKNLAALNRKYGLTAVYHTFSGGNAPRSVWDLVYLLEANKYSADELAINFDIGHMVAENPLSSWRTNVRYAMPHIRSVGMKDYLLQRSGTGTVSAVSVLAGTGFVQLREFFQLLLDGKYSGPVEAQYEYNVTGLKGTSFNLNTTFWADHADMASGNLTPDFLTTELRKDYQTYRDAILAAGWLQDQIS
jgi:hypothetical protein